MALKDTRILEMLTTRGQTDHSLTLSGRCFIASDRDRAGVKLNTAPTDHRRSNDLLASRRRVRHGYNEGQPRDLYKRQFVSREADCHTSGQDYRDRVQFVTPLYVYNPFTRLQIKPEQSLRFSG
ncbi:hypothetical protein BaRGS_00004108 [Batillaria attramentaria]|uniref:Uncharacterized protein n=1 Tax=Batillaria attramentaria TaxID=370345 RepID=A0ABD0LYW2_9CAEN